MREIVETRSAPAAIGPYSQAVRTGGMVFVSGQIPLQPGVGTIVETSISAQTRQVLDNLSAVLEAAGSGLDHVLKTTVYMTDLAEFQSMNEVYAQYFASDPPARATVQVAALPKGAKVEIDAVALTK